MIPTAELPTPWPSFIPLHYRTDLKELPRIVANRQLSIDLRALRDELAGENVPGDILQLIDRAAGDIAHWARYTDRQIEDLLLSVIEDRHLNLVTELVDDLCIDRRLIVDTLGRLEARDLVYKVKRFVPRSGRPQWMYKSCRLANAEVTFAYSDARRLNHYHEAATTHANNKPRRAAAA